MVHLHLPLTLHPACLHVEATSAGLSRRCSRTLISSAASGIARYATISDAKLQVGEVFSKEPPSFQNPYPYPTHAKPTPHQIFHLAPGATQDEIKKRCTSSIFITCLYPLDHSSSFITIKQQTTISFAHIIRIHIMLVFPPVIQQKPIRDFDLSKLLTIFYEDVRYRRTQTLAQRRPRKILIHTCMN